MIDRIQDPRLRAKRMDADAAAALIGHGMNVAMSGFTGAGYPKAVPLALASRVHAAHDRGEDFRIKVLTGASTAPELDGALARAEGIELRLPYQSDPVLRERINAGELEYIDLHLSHVAQYTWFGFFGDVDVAFISKLYVPADFTTDVTSTLVHVFAVKLTADPIVAPTAGRLAYVNPDSVHELSATWCNS